MSSKQNRIYLISSLLMLLVAAILLVSGIALGSSQGFTTHRFSSGPGTQGVRGVQVSVDREDINWVPLLLIGSGTIGVLVAGHLFIQIGKRRK